MKSRNLLEIQKSTFKSKNPLSNPEIHFEIQKSVLKSEISTWNPVDFKILYAEVCCGGSLGLEWTCGTFHKDPHHCLTAVWKRCMDGALPVCWPLLLYIIPTLFAWMPSLHLFTYLNFFKSCEILICRCERRHFHWYNVMYITDSYGTICKVCLETMIMSSLGNLYKS